jgi:hypothetical protein
MSNKNIPQSNKKNEAYNLIKKRVLTISNIRFGSRDARAFRHWQDYFTRQPIAGYIGWLGYENLGDEAFYIVFKELFSQFQILLYNNYNNPLYESLQDFEPIEIIFYRKLIKQKSFYDFVFLGGGTLINRPIFLDRCQHALQNGKQLVVFGTGVSDPSFWAKHHLDSNYSNQMNHWISVLQDAAYVSVRGPKSAKILEANGFSKAKVIGDPALSICRPKPQNYPRKGVIAINLGSHGFIWGKQEQINQIIAKLAHHLLENGWEVEFIPMHPIDLDVGLKIIDNFNLPKVSVWRDFRDIDKTINQIQSYDILVGQRLHSAVIACGCGVPSIMLEYQPKCGEFMESIGMQQFSIRTDILDLDKVLELIHDIDVNYVDYCKQLLSIGNHYRLLQRQAAEEINNLIQPLILK